MAITFDSGDPRHPRGHALLYFRDRDSNRVVATYLLVLPIQMDMGKYLPPLLASQLGSLVTESMAGSLNSFAAPPLPEAVESIGELERLAGIRGDDLVNGGTLSVSDLAAAMQETAEAVQAYAGIYQQYLDAQPTPAQIRSEDVSGGADVQQVLYGLMSERDRLAELSKHVGMLRFALERDDAALASESDGSMQALEELLPERYWTPKVRAAAHDLSDRGASLAKLYLERCYKLLDEQYGAVEALERQIAQAQE